MEQPLFTNAPSLHYGFECRDFKLEGFPENAQVKIKFRHNAFTQAYMRYKTDAGMVFAKSYIYEKEEGVISD